MEWMPRCSLSQLPIVFVLRPTSVWLCAVNLFDIFDRSSGETFPGLDVTCSWSHVFSFWWIVVLQRESCRSDPRFRHWLIVRQRSNNHRWSPLEEHRSLLWLLSLNINRIQMYRKNVLRNKVFCPWSNMIPIFLTPIIIQKFHRASRSGLGSQAFSSSSEGFPSIHCLRSHSAWYTTVNDDCPSCNISPVLHGNTKLTFSGMSTSFWFEVFPREFRMVASFLDVLCLWQIDHQLNFSPRLRRSPWTFQVGLFCAELMYSTLVFSVCWVEFYLSSKKSDRPIKWWMEPAQDGVWHSACRSCSIRR